MIETGEPPRVTVPVSPPVPQTSFNPLPENSRTPSSENETFLIASADNLQPSLSLCSFYECRNSTKGQSSGSTGRNILAKVNEISKNEEAIIQVNGQERILKQYHGHDMEIVLRADSEQKASDALLAKRLRLKEGLNALIDKGVARVTSQQEPLRQKLLKYNKAFENEIDDLRRKQRTEHRVPTPPGAVPTLRLEFRKLSKEDELRLSLIQSKANAVSAKLSILNAVVDKLKAPARAVEGATLKTPVCADFDFDADDDADDDGVGIGAMAYFPAQDADWWRAHRPGR
ncbi:hypothetical protein [Variovorax saccharolyticus]|uniref:hypothetical protein n=1 Tax=Variovorax saccharolyticus TaxID=3053516 RepID=UPI002575D437|nr:hypothetical protein [Variovorax sp. J31P216]MDM0030475.1 hypothetical protein [Variovorax sp. J31P216]